MKGKSLPHKSINVTITMWMRSIFQKALRMSRSKWGLGSIEILKRICDRAAYNRICIIKMSRDRENSSEICKFFRSREYSCKGSEVS